MLEQPTKRKRRHRVRFAEDLDADYHLLPELNHDQIGEMWYTKGDFTRLKETAKLICKESRSSTFVSLLRDSYGSSQRSLDLWAVHGRSLRGLEPAVAGKHGHQRRRCRDIMYTAVIEAQRQMTVSGVEGLDAALCLAKIASTCSKPAREFAIRMGRSDQRAVLDVYNPDGPNSRRLSHYIPRERAVDMKDWARRPSQLVPASTGAHSISL